MTKKHFETIAQTLRQQLELATASAPEARIAVINTITALSRDFEDTNPKFNQTRFLHACGLY